MGDGRGVGGGDFNGRGPQCVYVIKAKITVSWLQVDWNNNKGNDNYRQQQLGLLRAKHG